MKTVLVIAGRELANGLRNKWVAASVGLMLVFSLSLALVGSAPSGTVGASSMAVLLASLAGLSVFLLPLIALLLGHDAIAGEAERGSLILLLAYPITRWRLLAGKFLGHTAILALAVLLGFGGAGAAVAVTGGGIAGALPGFVKLVTSAVAMGAVFLSLGYLASALVAERSTAIGLAIGLWLFFAVVYDFLFLGVLLAVGEAMPAAVVNALILLNPADAFRLLNLGASAAVSLGAEADIAGAKTGLGPGALIAALAAWLAVAATAAWLAFRRREI